MLNSAISNAKEYDFNTYLTIGELAEAVTSLIGKRCTAAMIYNYERQELIPFPKRSPGGFRLYRPEDVNRVVLIKQRQEEGLSLADIKEHQKQNPDTLSGVSLPKLPVNRRMQILEAAVKVFPEKGYQKTTIQDIAREAGISTSAIYQYFSGKEDLFLALTERISFLDFVEDISVRLKAEKVIDIEDLRQTLLELAEAFMDAHQPNIEVTRLFFAEARRFPEVGAFYCKNLILPVENYLRQYLEGLIQQDVLPKFEVRLAVHAFFGIFLNFILAEEILFGKEVLAFPTEERTARLVDIYLHGILNDQPST